MHARQTLPIVLVLAVVVSGLWFVAPADARPAPATHVLATDTINPTDPSGYYQSDFYVGYSQGVVNFRAYDAVDTSATVAINDLNASRDGLTNPVFTATPTFTVGYTNYSFEWGHSYLIPLSLEYGGRWNMTISGANAGFESVNFTVHTYRAEISLAKYAYLPGHSAMAVFDVYHSANTAPYSHASVTVLGQYETATYAYLPLFAPRSMGTAAWGNVSFNIPLNASTLGSLTLVVYANVTTTQVNTSEHGSAYGLTGNVTGAQLTLSECAQLCGSTSSFPAGAVAYLSVFVPITYNGYYEGPAANMMVQLQFVVNGAAVVPPNVPLNLTTNASGGAEVLFIASSQLFSTGAANEIVATVTDPSNPSLGSVSSHVYFGVQSSTSTPAQLSVQLDSAQYYGGDTVTATWQLGTANASAVTGWTAGEWFAFDGNNNLLFWGLINSTASQGTVSFTLAANFGGGIFVEVDAYNASSFIYAEASAAVTLPTILLNPSELYYLPGDQVTVSVTTEGSVFASTTLYESVVTDSGLSLASGPLSGTQISISIPRTAPPGSITVSVAAQSPTLGVVSSNSISVEEASGYVLYAGVTTKSNYPDGSFQPGQTIQISYQLSTVGGAVLPKSFLIYVYPGSYSFYGGTQGTVYQESTSPSGTVSYTIPSSTPAGIQTFSIYVESPVCSYSCGGGSDFAVNVQPNPSPLNYELGAGSGLTVGWLVLLVLLIVVAIVLFLAIRRGRRGGARPESMKPFTPSSPPAGGASGEGAKGAPPSWQEPSSGDSGGKAPPMPGSPPQ